MKSGCVAAMIVMAISSLALAQETGKYRCTYGDMVRRIEILTEPGVTVPCEVHYYKDTETPGEKQVLWSAQTQAGYCEEKVDGLLTTLEGYGWECGRSEAPVAAPMPEAPAEEEVQDDTDVLSPGTPES